MTQYVPGGADRPPGVEPTAGPAPAPPSRPGQVGSRRIWAAAAGGAGLALVVLGSFLPWVVSGQVRRSSYEIVGVADRLGFGADGPLGLLIAAWPLLGPLCVLPVIAGALRWWRTAGALAALIGLLTGAVSIGALIFSVVRGRPSSIGLDPLGPAVMAVGSVVLIAAGIVLVLPARGSRASSVRTRMQPGT